MTDKSRAVLWIGLALIVMNLAIHWSELKAALFTSPKPASGGGSSWFSQLFGPLFLINAPAPSTAKQHPVQVI